MNLFLKEPNVACNVAKLSMAAQRYTVCLLCLTVAICFGIVFHERHFHLGSQTWRDFHMAAFHQSNLLGQLSS